MEFNKEENIYATIETQFFEKLWEGLGGEVKLFKWLVCCVLSHAMEEMAVVEGD